MQRLIEEMQTSAARGENSFSTYVDTVGDVPDECWQGWLVARAKLNTSTVLAIRTQDPDGYVQIAQFLLKCTLGLKLGEDGQSQSCLDAVIRVRSQTGNYDRIVELRAIVQDDGRLDWGRGIYRVEYQGAILRYFVHKPTGAKSRDLVNEAGMQLNKNTFLWT